MPERINRQNDEKLYQPRIHSQRIRELYIIKQLTGIPMTVLPDLAIAAFIEKSAIEELENPNSHTGTFLVFIGCGN